MFTLTFKGIITWSLESSAMYRRVVKLKLTDVSEVRTAYIISALMMETQVTSTWLYGATPQKTPDFILVAVRT
jgi:hypothetical protein